MNKSFVIYFVILVSISGIFWYSLFYKPTALTQPADVLIVGTSADYMPMSYKDNNEIVGFDIDIIKEIARRLNKKIEIKDMPFELLIPQLQLGIIQVIAAGMTITYQRAENVIFTQPYLTGDPLIAIALKDHPVTYDTLSGKQIIVNQGYTADLYLSKRTDIDLIRLPSIADALLALRAGKGDAFVTASNTFKPLLERYGDKEFSINIIPETNETTALAISQCYPELAHKIQTSIQDMLADGTIQAFKEKWHLL